MKKNTFRNIIILLRCLSDGLRPAATILSFRLSVRFIFIIASAICFVCTQVANPYVENTRNNVFIRVQRQNGKNIPFRIGFFLTSNYRKWTKTVHEYDFVDREQTNIRAGDDRTVKIVSTFVFSSEITIIKFQYFPTVRLSLPFVNGG